MTSEKRLTWKYNHPVWYCYNDKKEHLGTLNYERTGTFMHWCWYQMDMIRMCHGCLEEVRDKQKELHKKTPNDFT